MAGLDPAIYRGEALGYDPRQGTAVDGRVKPGHDSGGGRRTIRESSFMKAGIRACRQLSQMTLAVRYTAARKLREVLS